jgi:microsomal dipeptidase-like Zn-dependent dipeptidase
MLTIEGLQNLEGKAANLDRLYDAGFRMAGLTHFFDNELAGSMHGLKKGGLTPFGRDIVRRMEAKGMIIDIAHLSHKGVAEVLAMATRPVVSSHGGVQATCKVNRNLTDDEVRGVAKTGGVIGIGYWDGALCDTSPRAAAKAMKHVRDLVGIQHVALGSDYDGATTVRFDTSQLVQVTQALMDEGFTAAEIRAVMGENALRVIRAGLGRPAVRQRHEHVPDGVGRVGYLRRRQDILLAHHAGGRRRPVPANGCRSHVDHGRHRDALRRIDRWPRSRLLQGPLRG